MKHSRRYPLLVVSFAALVSACGCIFDPASSAGAAETPPAGAAASATPAPPSKSKDDGKVAVEWQEKMLAWLAQDQAATEAYGLFSEGGWSDAGQVVVLTGAGGAKPRLLVVNPGRKEPSIERALTAAEWKALSTQVDKAAKLQDVSVEGFDHLIFELVHAHKAGGKVAVQDRLYVSNPGVKSIPDHDAVIAAFQALRKPPQAK